MAVKQFRAILKRFEDIRNVSSPIQKLVKINRIMTEFMAGVSGGTEEETAEADNVIEMVFYILCKLETPECTFLGARFLEEVVYVNSFIHEDQIIIAEYTYIEHMNAILDGYFMDGSQKCEEVFITKDCFGTGTSSASEGNSPADGTESSSERFSLA